MAYCTCSLCPRAKEGRRERTNGRLVIDEGGGPVLCVRPWVPDIIPSLSRKEVSAYGTKLREQHYLECFKNRGHLREVEEKKTEIASVSQ